MTSTDSLRADLAELAAMLDIHAATDDDELYRRWAELDIGLTALETTARRADIQFRHAVVQLKTLEIRQAMAQLAIDLLGWYALPDEPAGANEPPVGGDHTRLLKSRHFECLVMDEARSMDLKDRLARFLETQQRD